MPISGLGSLKAANGDGKNSYKFCGSFSNSTMIASSCRLCLYPCQSLRSAEGGTGGKAEAVTNEYQVPQCCTISSRQSFHSIPRPLDYMYIRISEINTLQNSMSPVSISTLCLLRFVIQQHHEQQEYGYKHSVLHITFTFSKYVLTMQLRNSAPLFQGKKITPHRMKQVLFE